MSINVVTADRMLATSETNITDAGEKIIRHVTRDTREADIFTQGVARQIHWADVFKSILYAMKEEKIMINLVDTVLLERQIVMHYAFTDTEGNIAIKPKTQHNFKSIEQEFLKISQTLQRDNAQNVAISYNYGSSVSEVVDSGMFSDLCNAGVEHPFPSDLQMLQCFVPSKGSDTHYRTYRTTFWLDKSGPQFKTDRLDVTSEVSGSSGIRSKTNMSRLANKTMEATGQLLVAVVEKQRRCRVTKMVLTFVQDFNQKIWLVNTSECVAVTSGEDKMRSSSPAEFKLARAVQIANTQKATRAERDRERADADGRGPQSKSLNDLEGMMSSTGSGKFSRKGGPSSISPIRTRAEVPDARLGIEVAGVADNTALLGSSQLSALCKGDFCSYNVSSLESVDVRVNVGGSTALPSNSYDRLSSFRRAIMYNDPDSVSSMTKRGMSVSLAGPIMEDGKESVVLSRKIAQGAVIQCRQEGALVDLQLKRHKAGEQGDYVSMESQLDSATVSGMFPSQYYREVAVCETCFLVYRIIDEARQKAIKKIKTRKRGGSPEGLSAFSQSTFTDPGSSPRILPPNLPQTLPQMPQGRKKEEKERSKLQSTKRAKGPVGGQSVSTGSYGPNNSAYSGSNNGLNNSYNGGMGGASEDSLQAAMEAIDGLTKLDVSEIRTMSNPPAAVEVVLEAVMVLLTGKIMTFQDTRRLLNGGEAFLLMLQQFRIDDVTDARLALAEAYADNPVFRPKNVEPVSLCAAKFCAWVLGVVQAARWQRGAGHRRTDPIPAPSGASGVAGVKGPISSEEVPFHQKLAREKAKRLRQSQADGGHPTLSMMGSGPPVKDSDARGKFSTLLRSSSPPGSSSLNNASMSTLNSASYSQLPGMSASLSRSTHSPSRRDRDRESTPDEKEAKLTKRQKTAVLAAQKKSTARLVSQDISAGGGGAIASKDFKCSDGITVMPFIILGDMSYKVLRCNFVVIHDFFDTADATSLLFKPVVQHHSGCQALCFNYPGQANTVWPRLPAAERARGAREPVLNNDWVADRLHELLQYVEANGDMMLSNPFHLVGMGNGACIAAAFAQRWGAHPSYAGSIRSVVGINGFLYPDSQLTAVLHSATELFENNTHSRPDIPVSFWSRFIFSEEYLARVSPNLALNIYTAVSNPITNEGRCKVARGAMQHRDLRGGMAPDLPQRTVVATATATAGARGGTLTLFPVQVPLVLLQSTEDLLVNASNVDPYLSGRATKHLWSHQLNVPSPSALHHASDVTAQWAGKLSQGPVDYQKYSTLGKSGLKMLLDVLANPRGAFVMWTRTGHAIHQENKPALLDLLDALAYPSESYVGSLADKPPPIVTDTTSDRIRLAIDASTANPLPIENKEVESVTSKMEVMFRLNPPRRVVETGRTMGDIDDVKKDEKDEKKEKKEGKKEKKEAGEKGEKGENGYDIVGKLEATSGNSSPKGFSSTGGSEKRDRQKVNFNEDPKYSSHPGVTPALKVPLGTGIEPVVMALSDQRPMMPEPTSHWAATPGLASPSRSRSSTPSIIGPSNLGPNTGPNTGLNTEPLFSSSPAGRSDVTAVRAKEDEIDPYSYPSMPPVVIRPIPYTAPTSYSAPTPYTAPSTHTAPVPYAAPSSSSSRSESPSLLLLPTAHQPDMASEEQKERREWTSLVPSASEGILLEEQLRARQKEFQDLELQIRDRRAQEASARLGRLEEEQQQRRKQYEDEDKLLLEKLEVELEARRRERDAADKQRRLQLQAIEQVLVEGGLVDRPGAGPVSGAGAGEQNMVTTVSNNQGGIDSPRRGGDSRNVSSDPSPDKTYETNRTHGTDGTNRMEGEEGADGPLGIMDRGRDPVKEMPPLVYSEVPAPLIALEGDIPSQLDYMAQLQLEAKKKGNMTLEDFESVKRSMAQRQLERDNKLSSQVHSGQESLLSNSALAIQKVQRGFVGRKKAAKAALHRTYVLTLTGGVTLFQAVIRGRISRVATRKRKKILAQHRIRGGSVATIQAVYRGYRARKFTAELRRFVYARNVQRCFRGSVGRRAAKKERARLDLLNKKHRMASSIQSAWRMKVAKEEFRSLRIHMLAAQEIQRCFRGFAGRKQMNRRRKWEAATPGPERIQLGLQMIEESKAAFERQQEEIDALHRAQERAEARVSFIHSELKDSEQELVILERELQEIDQIERDLLTLTHERDVLASGLKDAAGMPRTTTKGGGTLVLGHESNLSNDPDLERRRKAETYALEMTIQIKRAEREKKRQELETEFSAVFLEVEKKKKALERLELSLADMESTRERKDREFRRLQANLMQLLLEQKTELDDLREKGIELETATAMTAAAATATAIKAKEHEKRSTVMFSQTEELMKFQFMSMSLSYFSSLNMLKQLRDMNSDTTSSAISASADAAASSAAAAAAANLPNIKKLDLGAGDFIDQSILKKKKELEASNKAAKDVTDIKANPLPEKATSWSVNDVCRWLDVLSLGQYSAAFREASVDGPFLMELREEDMVQVLGINHKLHVRKILVSREKLRPLNQQEEKYRDIVLNEEKADNSRAGIQPPPDIPSVFSQCRNGRIKRVEESINLGFTIDSEDEKGNTLLLVACQNSNKRMVEMLLLRGASVNHQNAQGNSALHFALAFDSEGLLGEYLIEHGADDTLENIEGLTPYDGVVT